MLQCPGGETVSKNESGMALLSIFRLFYLIGAVNALFFSALIFSKKKKTLADRILGSWLIILFAQLFIPFLYLTDLSIYYRYAGYEIAFYVFHPLMLHLYVKATIGRFPSRQVLFLNLAVVVVSELSALSFLFYPAKERLLFIEGKAFLPYVYIPLVLLMLGYFTYSIYAAYKSLKDYKKNVLQVYSYRENVDLLWLRRLVLLFGGISLFIFPLGIVSYYGFHSLVFADYFFFVALAFFVFFFGYWGYQQGQIFSFNNESGSNDDDISDKTTALPDENVHAHRQYKKEAGQLTSVMKLRKPYLEPTLSIHDLAQFANMQPHLLSKVINKEFHCNFFEFINAYRIEEFKQQVFLPENKNLTILGIAFNCGFNSKSAFNRIFKEITGLTPGDFIRNNRP